MRIWNLTPNFEAVWPQKAYISLFSFNYHIAIAFSHMRLFRTHFALDLTLLQKQEFSNIDLQPQYNFEASQIILGDEW